MHEGVLWIFGLRRTRSEPNPRGPEYGQSLHVSATAEARVEYFSPGTGIQRKYPVSTDTFDSRRHPDFWRRFVGLDGRVVGIDRFGMSAPGDVALAECGMTVDEVVRAVRETLTA